MRLNTRGWTRGLGLALAATLLTGPAGAAEIDKYLPADTETVVIVNIRQMLGSKLAKKADLNQLRDALRNNEEVDALLKDLGLDLFKDVDKIIAAGPAKAEQDKGLIIIHGRFNVEKFKARAEKEAKDNKDRFAIQKVKDGAGGEHTVYEVKVPNPQGQGQEQTLFTGMASKTTILAAPSKDYLVDALRVKPDATKVALKSKAFRELLSRLDEQQSLGFAMLVTEELLKSVPADLPIGDVLKTVTAAAGGITLTDGIKLEVVVSTKEAADAKALKEKISEGINTGLALLALAAMNQKEIAPLVEVIKSIKPTTKDNTVTVKGEVSGEMLEKLTPKKDDE
jgi:hypothetical protein